MDASNKSWRVVELLDWLATARFSSNGCINRLSGQMETI